MDVIATTVIRLEELHGTIGEHAAEILEALEQGRADHPALAEVRAEVAGPAQIRLTLEFSNIADDVDDIEDWCHEIITDAIGEPVNAGERQRRGSLALTPA